MPSIVTNIPSMTAQRNLSATQTTFHKAVTRLSSGLRINSAADDAAGMFLSEKLKNQVRGLQQASRNAQDGISVLQTAEGGLSVHHSILLRLRELSVQSANGVMTDGDRALSIAPEARALLDELSRVAQTTQFNGLKLLDGTMGGVQVTGVGTAVGNNAQLINPDTLASVQTATSTAAAIADGTGLVAANGIDNVWASSVPSQTAGTAANTPVAFRLTSTAVSGDASTLTLTQFDTAGAAVGAALTATVSNISQISGSKMISFSNGVTVMVNNKLGSTAIAGANGGFAVSSNIKTVDPDSTTAGNQTTTVLPPGADGLILQVGANNVASDRMTLLNMNSMTAKSLGLEKDSGTGSSWDVSANLKTQTGAQNAIDIIDKAIEQVSTLRSKIGAYQNRMEYTVTNLGVAAENQAAANSRIVDADVAREVSEMVKTQILSQSAMAILAQANAAPQALLSLFR